MEIEYISGWGREESDDVGPFRWMEQEASIRICGIRSEGRNFLRLVAGHSFAGSTPRLSISVNGEPLGQALIESSFSSYSFALDSAGDIDLRLKMDSAFHVEGDPRSLGIMVRNLEFLDGTADSLFLDGWYDPEDAADHGGSAGRWMRTELLEAKNSTSEARSWTRMNTEKHG